MVLAASPVSHPKLLISSRFSFEDSSAAEDLQPSQLPFVADVKSRLQEGAYRLEASSCPCGEANGVVISEVDRYGLPLSFVLCASCGTVRIDPYLDKSSLEDFYTRSYQQMYARATDVESYFSKQKSYGEKVLATAESYLKPGSWIYEIGCGAGGALDVFQSKGYKVAGCDFSAELIAAGRQRGVRDIFHGSLKEIRPQPDGLQADLIYLHHVFEHVNHPLAFLRECRDRLKPGGRIIIIVPDVSGIDRFACPAGDLMVFLHIAHKYNFSFAGLRKLGSRGGYHVHRLRPDPKLQTRCSHMPELWVEFVLDDAAALPDNVASPQSQGRQGDKMLRYLRQTEKLFSMGLCRGQLRQRLSSGRNSVENTLVRLRRATPAKVIRKLRGMP